MEPFIWNARSGFRPLLPTIIDNKDATCDPCFLCHRVAAVKAQAVAVHAAGREQFAGHEGDGAGVQCGGVDVVRQLHPQHLSALWPADARLGGEVARNGFAHGGDLPPATAEDVG